MTLHEITNLTDAQRRALLDRIAPMLTGMDRWKTSFSILMCVPRSTVQSWYRDQAPPAIYIFATVLILAKKNGEEARLDCERALTEVRSSG